MKRQTLLAPIFNIIVLLSGETAKKEEIMKIKAVNKNAEFLRAYRRGQSYVGKSVVLYVIKNRYGAMRFGITSSKKVGNAVKRNRSRRLIREAVRALPIDTTKNLDLILVARSKTPYCKAAEVTLCLKNLCEQAGILKFEENETPQKQL